MAATMVFGSLIAGATSEGGGAVAFPVLTLVFKSSPPVARDFALMIQSVGMTAAALSIFIARIPIAKRAIVLAWLGGVPGMLLGIHVVGPMLPPASTKLAFVSLWLAFGLALGWTLRMGLGTHRELGDLGPGRAAILMGCGLIGGTISGVCGSGIDIVTFSALTLAFGLDEGVATPTSVVLMAGNAVVGFAARLLDPANPISMEAWGYWWAAVPVVVVGAPAGARIIAGRSRELIVRLLQGSVAIQFIGALALIPLTQGRIEVVVTTFVSGLLLFSIMRRLGRDQRPEAT
ncbi:MAG: sulfite exporter TauE/SafE family protein [Alphaproteobacteria bacterium]|nr:sulfite exporter TauE/SafE family protein [Alphaproteobacteria bacterium]MCB9792819.1 sulfite exporter TauE/SafE family protein [Alphaproteobacteria bacterium]